MGLHIAIDPQFKNLIPPLSRDELVELEASLKADGCRDRLATWKGILLDGHNRLAICTQNGIPFETIEIRLADRDAALDWIDRSQLGRRNLNPEAARMIRGRMYEREKKKHGGDRKSKPQNGVKLKTSEVIAKKTGVSKNTIERDAKTYRAIEASPVKELGRMVMSGKMKATATSLAVVTGKEEARRRLHKPGS